MADPCGAKTRSGGKCQKAPLKGKKRCKLHGGKSSGPKDAARPDNTNAVKHGFYSTALFDDDERSLYSQAEVGGVDDEIKLAKVKLYRYVKAANSVTIQEMVDGALEVIQKQGTDMRDIPYDKRELKACAPNYAELIIKTLDLIRKLELARVQIAAAKHGGGAGDDLMREDTFITPDEPIPDKPIL